MRRLLTPTGQKLGLLILIVLAIGCGAYLLRIYPPSWLGSKATAPTPAPEPPPMTEPGVISVEELNAAPKGEILVVDARAHLFYKRSHIPGAINIAREYLARDLPNADVVLNQNRSKRVVVYCSADDCDDALTVARELLHLGMKRVYVFKGGWKEWEAASLAEEKG